MRLRQRLLYLLVPTVVCAAITAVATAVYLPTRYRSETVILVVPQRVPESYVRSSVTTRIDDRLSAILQRVLGRTRLENIIQEFNLYPEERQTGIMEDIVEGMRTDITMEVVRGDALRIAYIGGDRQTVLKVTERLASLVIEENLRDRETLAESTSQFLESQLEETRVRITEKEAELKGLPATTSTKVAVDQDQSPLGEGSRLLDSAGVAERLASLLPEETVRDRGVRARSTARSEADLLEYEVLKDTFKALLAKKQEAAIAANLERRQVGEQFKIVDPARIPEDPIGPSRGLVNAAGAGVGLGLGLVVMFVRTRKRHALPDAAVVSAPAGRLWAAPHVLVFVLLFVLLFVFVVMFGAGLGTASSTGADSQRDGFAPASDSSSGF